MSGLRSSFAVLVALPLLMAGPALAAHTYPTDAKPGRATAPAARRPVVARKGTLVATATKQVIAVAVAPAAVAAQPTASATRLVYLTGVVVGGDGQPCPGACVYPPSNPRLIAVADAHGVFQLQVPVAAASHLQADFFGLGSSRIAIDAEHPQPVRFVLGN